MNKECALQSLFEEKMVGEQALRLLLERKAKKERALQSLLEGKMVGEQALWSLFGRKVMKERGRRAVFAAKAMKDETLSLYLHSERLLQEAAPCSFNNKKERTMAEINGIDLAHMPNGAHYLFALDVSNKAKANEKVAERAATQVDALEKCVAEEDEALKLTRKSLLTDEIKAMDDKRDEMYSYYRKGVKAFLGAPLEDVAEAAKELDQHMTDYAINPQMQLDKETGLLLNFTADLVDKYAEQVAKLGLTMYVTALKEANDSLHELTTQRTDERSLQVAGALKSARAATDNAYRSLVKLVNALSIVEADEAYDEFINYVNTEIKHYKEEVLSSSSSKKKAATATTAGETA